MRAKISMNLTLYETHQNNHKRIPRGSPCHPMGLEWLCSRITRTILPVDHGGSVERAIRIYVDCRWRHKDWTYKKGGLATFKLLCRFKSTEAIQKEAGVGGGAQGLTMRTRYLIEVRSCSGCQGH